MVFFTSFDSNYNPVFDNIILSFRDLYDIPQYIDILINDNCKIKFIPYDFGYLLQITYDDKISYFDHLNNSSILQDILTLLYGKPKYIQNVFINDNNIMYHLFYGQTRYNKKEHNQIGDYYFDIKSISKDLSKIFDIYIKNKLFNEYYVQFFLMAQYFNLYSPIKYLYFLESLNCYFERKELGKNNDYKNEFKSKMIYQENEGLGTRIEYIFTEFIKQININNFISYEFIKKIVNTRTFMAHSGAFTDQNKLTFRLQYLPIINDLLLLLNSYCIFKELELDNEIIKIWMQKKLNSTIQTLQQCKIIDKQ